MALSDAFSEARPLLRGLRNSSGYALTAVLMLALAAGVVAGLYTVVHQLLLTPLPYAEPQRLVYVAGTAPGSELTGEFGLSREFPVHYSERSQLLDGVATYSSFTNTLRADDRAERLWMSSASASLFATLGVAPALGRLPGPQDREVVVVLSDQLWAEWFNRDPTVIGRTVVLFGAARQVVGVMPPGFHFPQDNVLLWMSRQTMAADIQEVGSFENGMVARLKPGVSEAQLADELSVLARELPERFGGSTAYADTISKFRAVVRPLDVQLLGPYARPLWLLLGAGTLVLLIAGANLVNLYLIRAEGRQRELGVRRALGAQRLQLLRLQLTEALLIGAVAGVLAAALAAATLPLLLSMAPAEIPRLAGVQADGLTLGVALALAVCASLLAGLLAAWRGSAPELQRLREGGRGMTARQQWWRHGLVAGQSALALVLLIGAGLLLRSAQALREVDPGYDPSDLYTFQFAPEQAGLPRDDAAAWARFHQQFLQRLAALPGVERVGLIENVPLNEGTGTIKARSDEMAGPAASGALLNLTYTAGDYFRAMDIQVLAGRGFEAGDHEGRGSILVSERAARLLWPDADPVGRRLQREGQSQWDTVVGVVEDIQQSSLTGTPEPLIYLPLLGPDPATSEPLLSPGYVVKSRRADQIAADVRALVREVAPEAPIYRQFTMQQLVDDSMVQLTFTLLTLGIAAALALSLGAIGLYGVLSYGVAERTREIGVRMALGAPMPRVLRMIVVQGSRLVGLGVIIGLLVAAGLSQALGSLLYGVQAIDGYTYGLMALIMLAVGLIASYLPARRAAALDPMQALRRE